MILNEDLYNLLLENGYKALLEDYQPVAQTVTITPAVLHLTGQSLVKTDQHAPVAPKRPRQARVKARPLTTRVVAAPPNIQSRVGSFHLAAGPALLFDYQMDDEVLLMLA
jgi:hypothetical protein